jgi:hypothetical protein
MNLISFGKAVADTFFGGDPHANRDRYNANADLRAIADYTQPWTKDALLVEVRRWIKENE